MNKALLFALGTALLPAMVSAERPHPANLATAPAGLLSQPALDADSNPLVFSSPPPCRPLPEGAVAWWRGESNTFDAISGLDATHGAPRFLRSQYVSGKVGSAFLFPSSPSRLTQETLLVPAYKELDVGSGEGLTFECWIRPDLVSAIQPVVEWNYGASTSTIGVGLALSGSAIQITLTDTNPSPYRRIVFRSATGLVTNLGWQHVAFTFDKSSGQATTYYNGVSVAQTNLGAFEPQTRSPIYIGSRPSDLLSGQYFSGSLDELTIFDRALSPDEIRLIVAADTSGKCPPPPPPCAPLPPGAVAWWRAESNRLDSVGANNGQALNSISYTNGIVGRAFLFNNGYVLVPASSNLNVGLQPGFTVEGWVFPDAVLGVRSTTAGEYLGWDSGGVRISIVITNDLPFFKFATFWEVDLVDSHHRSHIIRSPADLPWEGAWQHLALTYDKATGDTVIYFNGSAVTTTNIGPITPQTAGNFCLGRRPSNPFPGQTKSPDAFDEVAVYARALAPSEIRSIVLSRGLGKCQEPPVIVTQPANLRINRGATAVFEVTANGNPILRHQWRKNGTAIPGATRSSLSLPGVQSAQAGTYSVMVTNAFGVALSSDALLTVNLPPVADASATRAEFIAPIQCPPAIVLNGSLSSDPDGDSLNYLWFLNGSATPIATGAVAVVTLPSGLNSLLLSVDDGLATNSCMVEINVLTLPRALERLIDFVNSNVSNPRPLTATLSAALASLNHGATIPALNQLEAFLQKIAAQVSPTSPALAETLAQNAAQLIGILGRDCTKPQSPAKLAGFSKKPNGKLRLEFTAAAASLYIIEASTDLVEWVKIGVADNLTSGSVVADDLDSSKFPARFYRLVTPQAPPLPLRTDHN